MDSPPSVPSRYPRFLLHVLPEGLQRIRHYGFLSNRAKKHALPRCRALLGAVHKPCQPPPSDSSPDAILTLTGVDIHRCPACGGSTLTRVETLPPVRALPGCLAPIRAPPKRQEVG